MRRVSNATLPCVGTWMATEKKANPPPHTTPPRGEKRQTKRKGDQRGAQGHSQTNKNIGSSCCFATVPYTTEESVKLLTGSYRTTRRCLDPFLTNITTTAANRRAAPTRHATSHPDNPLPASSDATMSPTGDTPSSLNTKSGQPTQQSQPKFKPMPNYRRAGAATIPAK
jgi:hypothetical protein